MPQIIMMAYREMEQMIANRMLFIQAWWSDLPHPVRQMIQSPGLTPCPNSSATHPCPPTMPTPGLIKRKNPSQQVTKERDGCGRLQHLQPAIHLRSANREQMGNTDFSPI